MVALKSLFELHNLSSTDFPDTVHIGHNMSGLEADPRNDWLHVALAELQRFQGAFGEDVPSAAFIGSANGIDVIAALRMFKIKALNV